ncbi:MAG: ATP-binding protein [Candidatus Micrarchaeota archaeon]
MNLRKTNILLVDDDPLDCRLVKMALAKSSNAVGFTVHRVESLTEAMESLNSHSFDLVLLDLGLPDSHGLETVDRVYEACPSIPIVVLTGLASEEAGVEAIKKGAMDYLVKDEYSGDMLVRAIRYSLERKRLKEQLRKHREHLEELVKERTAELERTNEELQEEIRERKQTEEQLKQAKQQAEAANRAKSDFLANMSHELRTPLHIILSFAGFGVKKYATAQPDKLLDYFDRIRNSGKMLLGLLNNLLDLAKLESGKIVFEPRPANLDMLVESVVEELKLLASERNLAICVNEPSVNKEIVCDAEKIKQVLRNLLSNAIKFSPEGGVIDVTKCCRDGSVTVSVRNQGSKVPEDELEDIFEKFVQSTATRTGAGGTGLGLAICREIITAHKGRIWVENRPEGGVAFSFEIPISMKLDTEPEVVLVGDDNDAAVR